ncbi:DUF86 domain-containing protein [Candidatus Micrarchaeota archaeon]|nr:DUF86 domain-containing protein [Candidatus Micrarchaeota archaeon]
MYDLQRLKQIFLDMDRYFGDLASLNARHASDLRDRKTFYAASMVLFSILNRAIDLGEEIVAAKKLGVPSTYRDIFRLLSEASLIDGKLEKELSSLVGYRNMLAHEYSDFSEKDVFRILNSVHAVRLFSQKMQQLVSTDSSG